LQGLRSASGFLQSKLGKRIDTRYTPQIEFLLDQGVKKSIEVARILKEVLPEPDAAEDTSPSPEPEQAPESADERGTAESEP
jgi:ribosome-binding factor A